MFSITPILTAQGVRANTSQSAKLPLTIPRRLEDNPAYLNYRSEGGRTLYGEDLYVGYRYFENMKLAPLFPFGHGLSYASFAITDLNMQSKPNSSSEATVSTEVSNTGSVAGAEVVQVYIAPVKPRINRPLKELKGFSKVSLEPGEGKRVEVDIDVIRGTSFWDENESKWLSFGARVERWRRRRIGLVYVPLLIMDFLLDKVVFLCLEDRFGV